MKAFSFSILTILLLNFSCKEPAMTSEPIGDAFQRDSEQIRELITEIFNTAKAKDMAKLDSYHLNSPKFTKYDDGEIQQRQDYVMAKRTEEEFFGSVDDFSYELPDVKVDVFDDVAISTFTLEYEVTLQDTTVTGKARSTLVFVKDKEQWKIIHEHFSPYMDIP